MVGICDVRAADIRWKFYGVIRWGGLVVIRRFECRGIADRVSWFFAVGAAVFRLPALTLINRIK
jgi:hypothetical protein